MVAPVTDAAKQATAAAVASKGKQLGLADIIGIVASCIVGVAAAVGTACCVRKCRNKRKLAQAEACDLPRALPCEPVKGVTDSETVCDMAEVMTVESDSDKPRALPA